MNYHIFYPPLIFYHSSNLWVKQTTQIAEKERLKEEKITVNKEVGGDQRRYEEVVS